MNPLQSTETWLRKLALFSGCATATKFWRIWAAKVALLLIAGSVNSFFGLGLGVLMFLPALSAGYRKLSDAGLQPRLIVPIAVGLIILQFTAPMLQLFAAFDLRAMAAILPIGDWLLIVGCLALQLFVLVLLIRETEPATSQYGPSPYEVAP